MLSVSVKGIRLQGTVGSEMRMSQTNMNIEKKLQTLIEKIDEKREKLKKWVEIKNDVQLQSIQI